ncbi:LysR family transcriptional regulator [Thalassospira sp. A40-3]|uniref:LysR family transcriptional regulator n=1 Tax=unclassified Thalassospira TaxID=2648997 RepID=UPI0018CFB9AE|nr:LysR family transcriptional regulator [Thalassospira sp. A40-3]QPO13205.1 LysR family transcriptional regulator [Thalassospira sp. A40-3]
MLEWDDLKLVLAVGRARSITQAARQTSIHHSTLFRRMADIESRIGAKLFERQQGDYQPTPAGLAAIETAEKLEAEMAVLARTLAGQDIRPTGTLRLTTTDTLLHAVLADDLAAFAQAYPEITVQVVTDNRFYDLNRHDADIAIRPSNAPNENLVGRQIAPIRSVVCAAKGMGDPKDGDGPWITCDESLAHIKAAQWRDKHFHDQHVAMRSNSLLNVARLVNAGAGYAVLPMFLAGAFDNIAVLGNAIDGLDNDLWMLMHRDLKAVPRVRAFNDFIFPRLKAKSALFAGA